MEPMEREREKVNSTKLSCYHTYAMAFKHTGKTHGQAQAFNPSTQEPKQEDSKFQASLGYIVKLDLKKKKATKPKDSVYNTLKNKSKPADCEQISNCHSRKNQLQRKEVGIS